MNSVNLKNSIEQITKVLTRECVKLLKNVLAFVPAHPKRLKLSVRIWALRERRVRQIEALGLKQLTNKNVLEPLKPAFELIEKYLFDYGGVRREDYFLKELASYFP